MLEYNNESEIEAEFYNHFKEYIQNNDVPFEKPTLQKHTESGKISDIYIQSVLKQGLVIELKYDGTDEYLLSRENIKQARDYAQEYGHTTFALANSKDLFLFDYNNETDIAEIDNYYLNLREYTLSEIPAKVLGAVEELYDRGELPEQLDKDRIIGILRTFHSHTYPTYKRLIKNQYGKNREFKHKFENWVEQNDYTRLDTDEQLDTLAKQHTYALTNRLLFYKLLTDNKIGEKYDVVLDSITIKGQAEGLQSRVETQFNKVTEKINYEPIFSIEDDIFELIPHSKKTDKDFQQLLRNFKQFDLTEIDEDLIGQLYEELIPPSERDALGQFYTPPSVAETIVKWTLGTENGEREIPRVLDPACGSGTFPVEVYKELDANYNAPHQDIIDNISVVDINKFPLHLTGINLTSRNITEPTNHIDSFHGSFFDYPEPPEKGKYDAVVGNPPYIKSDNIPDQDEFREHLKEYNPDGNKVPEYYQGTKKLGKNTDAYIYFITNAVRYLEEKGRLGVIVPSKWMETKYGEDFQQFLFDNVKIQGIVSFNNRIFEDALVDTSLLLLEKCSDESERNTNIVNFMKVTGDMNPEDIVNEIEYSIEIDEEYMIESLDKYSITSIKQNSLKHKNKWTYLYNAPPQLIELIEKEGLKKLSTFANLSRGTNTGSVSFFFIDKEKAKELSIEKEFLKPAFKSIKEIDTITISEKDTDKYLLDIHWYAKSNNIDTYDQLKKQLETDNFHGVYRYLEYGVGNGEPEKSLAVKRNLWCCLEKYNSPDVIHPRFFNDRVFTIDNKDESVVSDSLQCIDFTEEYNRNVVFALTNSHIYKSILEFWGRVEGGGALQIPTYRLKSMPFPDLDELSKEQEKRLEESYKNILNDDYRGIADEVILELLGMENEISVEELETIQNALVKSRIEGIEPDVLLNKGVNEEAGAFKEFV